MSERYGFKVIMTGDTAVGKTSLIRRFCDNKFNKNQKPSIGADFTIKVINFPKCEVILTLWDVGGQALFDNLRAFYYQGSDAGIITFDVTEMNSLENVRKKWIPEMRAIGNIPILILANKVDLDDKRVISTQDCNTLSSEFNIQIIETSAKTGVNVKKAFETIARMLIK
ncbi:MAG: Rab family GTPase [Candidatus Helarchaeota archaeon]